MPAIGDLIIQKNKDERYFGLVTKIVRCNYGHQRNVFIEWVNDDTPPEYNKKHGYAGINIHNCRREFDIIREGKSVS
tara:strand:- start:841 stop:1071 length:231 start_codon:yes stop_codon:yes gene_type:complete